MGVLRSYPSSNVSTMSHRMSQPGCQGVSSPPPCSRGLSGWRKNTERGKTVGWEDGSECVSLPPLSSTSTLSRGVTSYLRPGAVSLAASMARGALSLSLSLFPSSFLSLSLPFSLSLGWTAERTRVCGAVVCAHMGAGEGERGWVMDRDPESPRRRRELHPFSHVFDMGVVPTGVKEGRADWAE